MTSANGEVISRCWRDPQVAKLFAKADIICADGQPMVFASRLLYDAPLPERVATTDLFHDVARRAEHAGVSFYLFGATEEENRAACERVQMRYPRLKMVGRCHGYLAKDALKRQVAEINERAPDILWIGLGVPRQEAFCGRFAAALGNVGVLKTCGGLFNFLSGRCARAPRWMQEAGLEWMFRVLQEPRRLAWRYALTNPHAFYLLARTHTLGHAFEARPDPRW
ncbi:MAG: N-acetylglucosaminyldiphosphoundecaprenol N-acetyl-beta-D-mannosaminyltransferase [Alphaproteobacteria bacterium]|jgi:exopolysaccharide biosynthesis WecB/TagA/CpsF family protein|nr:N-acetylglucosaminyldiphosphoundecaprenol N-acetyl-beta-D-mannosaminyltransferase [Alphaproteobacteria bacterium]